MMNPYSYPSLALRLFLTALLLLTPFSGAFAQRAQDPVIWLSTPGITITTGAADTAVSNTAGAHEAIVVWKFGTVAGTFTTCTVQAYTSFDGGAKWLILGSAIAVTVTSSTTNVWRINEASSGSVSTTTSPGFGPVSKYTFACSGAYGTSAPVTVNVVYNPTDAGSLGGGGAGSVVEGSGTAGTAAGGVLTVQGQASMTPLIIIGSAGGVPVPVTINGIKYNATPATLADQATGDLQIDSTQNLKVTGSGTAGTASLGVFTVQFANSANPFQTIVCPTNAFRAYGFATVTGTTTSNLVWRVNDGTTATRTAAGSGFRWYVYSAQITNSGATNATVDLTQDAATPVTIASKWVAPTNTTPFGGSNMMFPSGLFNPTTNTALSIGASASSTSITVNVQGCVGP